MKLSERQTELLALLARYKRLSVGRLSSALHVSEMTVRRELQAMEQKGLLRRYHGGAVAIDENGEQPIQVRSQTMDQEKKRLAQLASVYLEEGCCVFLDSSSTTSYLIPHIAALREKLVVTNSVRTLLLLGRSHIPAILVGGKYYENDMCLVGEITEQYVDQLNVDVAFLSCLGLSEDGRVTDVDPQQTGVRRRMMKNARKTVFMIDSTKFGRIYPHTLCREGDEDVAIITVSQNNPE